MEVPESSVQSKRAEGLSHVFKDLLQKVRHDVRVTLQLSQEVIVAHSHVQLKFIYFVEGGCDSEKTFGFQKLRLDLKKWDKEEEDLGDLVSGLGAAVLFEFINVLSNDIGGLSGCVRIKIEVLFVSSL